MARVIAVANNKGGTAKSCTAYTLVIGLVKEGKKVLAIDNDPQGHLSKCLGGEYPGELEITLNTIMEKLINDETWGQTGPKSDNPVIEVNISELVSFKDHPFKVQDDEKMADMMESIKQYGVLHPIIARPIEGGNYEIIAGHRRKYACEKLGIEKIPVRVLELDDDNATILMVQTNFCQREELLPSEKAKGYRKEFDARKTSRQQRRIYSRSNR